MNDFWNKQKLDIMLLSISSWNHYNFDKLLNQN